MAQIPECTNQIVEAKLRINIKVKIKLEISVASNQT